MENEIHIRTCCRCKCEFESVGKKSYVCPDCRKKNKRWLDNERNKEYKRLKRVMVADSDELFERVREVDKYNAEHGTRYSYGKYELLKFLKKL